MTIKRKLILLSCSTVCGTVFVLMLVSSWLITNQILATHLTRMEKASEVFRRELEQDLDSLDFGFKAFQADESTVRAVLDAIQQNSFIHASVPELFELTETLALDQFAFYYPKEIGGVPNGGDVLQLYSSSDERGVVRVVDDHHVLHRRQPAPNRILAVEPDRTVPEQPENLTGYRLHVKEGQVVVTKYFEYWNLTPSNHDGGFPAGARIGIFRFEKPMTLDLKALEHEEGVVFNLFTIEGRSIGGRMQLEPASGSELPQPHSRITLNNADDEAYRALVSPLVHDGVKLGLLTAGISNRTTMIRVGSLIGVLALTALVILLPTVGLVLLFVGRLTRPIHQLTLVAADITKDVTQSQLKATESIDLAADRLDELGLLSRSFEVMRSSIQEKIRTIESQNEAVKQSEGYLREAQHVARIGSFEGVLQDNELWWSDELYMLFGLDSSCFIPTKQGFRDLLHPDDREEYGRALKNTLETGSRLQREFRVRHTNGQWRQFETIANTTVNERGEVQGLRGTVQDISDRKHAESELRRFEYIVSSSTDMLALLDQDFVYLAANEAYLNAFGKSHEELVGLSVPEIFGQEFFDSTIRHPAEQCMAGEPVRYQEWFNFPATGRQYMDIAYFPYLDVGDEIKGFVVCGRNMTQHKNAEEALLANEERFRNYFQLGLVGMAITSPSKGWLQVNHQLCEILGYPKEELVRLSWLELTHPDDLEEALEYFNQVISGETEGYSTEKRYIRKDGQVIHASIEVRCVRNEDRSVEYFVVLVQDITERWRSQEREARMRMELDHRVKNTIAAILSLSEQTAATSHNVNDYKARLNGRLRSLARTHEDLANSNWATTDLLGIITRTTESFAEDGRIRIDGPPVKLPPEAASPFCMAIHELATNAAKYGAWSVPSGCVDIGWRQIKGHLELHWRESGGPPAVEPKEPGVGTSLIRGFLSYELGGTVSMKYLTDGFECHVNLPISEP
ncbi:MAG: PAS domain S-box protein [Planctomycetota bacterium]|nr:PAS domain S-box protein [Planctomycetota bacterium]